MRQTRIALLAALVLFALSGKVAAAEPLPTITVMGVYPGANAGVLADTVAAPIEQQVNGVENMRRMWSRCTDDGSYSLTITFRRGTELNLAQVLVQNRVSLALPVLPEEVKRRGLTVLKSPVGVLMIVPLLSPGGRYDGLYLSNYATINLRDELARVEGVADVRLAGQREHTLRIWADPAKLAARKLTAADVLKALKGQNLQVEAGKVGPGEEKGFRFSLSTLGRLTEREKLGDIVVKVQGPGSPLIRLKDVARIELGAKDEQSYASLDGKPAVALVIYLAQKTRPGNVSAAVKERLAKLRGRFPKGIDFGPSFDFTLNLESPKKPGTPEYLLGDVALPDGASPQRVHAAVARLASQLRQTRGVSHVLALAGADPFDCSADQICLLASLAPADRERGSKEQILKEARRRLQEVRNWRVRLCDLSSGLCSLEMIVSGPESAQAKKLARKIAERLRRTTAVTGLRGSAEERSKGIFIEVDVEEARKLGVEIGDINTVLQTYLGSLSGEGFKGSGRVWRLRIPGNLAEQAKGIRRLQVRNSEGKIVPLGTMVSLSVREATRFVYRLDLRPAERITASPADGVAPAIARKVCDKAAEEVRRQLRLPASYRLSWLHQDD
jgi:multidrug efflux pump subunit AcrB